MNRRRATALAIGIAAAVSLAVLCWCGVYVRYKADDFWTASIVARLGFWKSQTWWYQRWSGRFAYTFFIGIVESIGPAIVPALVALTIAAWIAATSALFKALRFAHPVAFALAFVYAVAEGTPDVPQSILWQTGLLTYVVPMIGLTAWLATAVNRDSLRWYDVVVPFVVAGFSESNTITQIIALAALVVVFRKRSLAAGLIASIAALTVIALAPGNAVRMSIYPRHPVAWVVSQAIAGSAMFFVTELTRSGIALLTIFIAALLLAPRIDGRFALVTIAVAVCSTVVTYAASLEALAVAPPARTLIVPHFFVVIAVAAIGMLVPAAELKPAAALAITAIALVAPVVSALQLGRDIPQSAAFARAWDRLDAGLRRNPGREIVVAHAPGSAGTLAFITHSPDAWSNHCISDYYSLAGIASAPPGKLGAAKLLEDLPVYATEGPRRHDDHDIVRLRFTGD